jgi:hypothetical protein
LAILRSRDSRSEGKRIKFENIAKSSVIETKEPRAIVPPKLEIVNTENPKKRTIDV